MDKDSLIQLTNNLYKMTLLFPKKEPLRYKMRELADDILASPNQKDLETLDSFFEVAKNQNWISPKEILNLQQEYSKLKGELKKSNLKGNETKQDLVSMSAGGLMTRRHSLLERQEQILAFLKENGRAQVWQIKQIFPEVTKRTLRRDFEHLLGQGVIERIGERNDTFYQFKGRT